MRTATRPRRPRSDGATVRLYNSLTRRKDVFEPGDPERVTMYVCGPTVYSFPHIGNARPAVVFDVLFRVLMRRYPKVVYARNITDLDDKINAAASADGVPIGEITRRFERAYHEDMEALGVLPPGVEPRATQSIDSMIEMIRALLARGHAYEVEGHVLFSVATYGAYGHLSRRDRREMIAGARVEVAPYKKDPADFVLWKPSTGDQPGWDSPWGHGRPGWHLECSAMIETHLGATIDIHGGGHDLQFPHHENELAQSTCAHDGAPLCRYWVHNGFVNVDAEKMSKSLGNVLLVRDLLQEAPGEAVRFALLSAHYRKPLDWSSDTLPRACRVLDRLYSALQDAPQAGADEPAPAVAAALEDDLNSPKAIALLHEMAQAVGAETRPERRSELQRAMRASGAPLGILQRDAQSWADSRRGSVGDVDEIERLVHEREQARARRDFTEADRIRNLLHDRGIVLEDGPDGTQWRKAG
jgi:cysteinyl-tRNA synthetase